MTPRSALTVFSPLSCVLSISPHSPACALPAKTASASGTGVATLVVQNIPAVSVLPGTAQRDHRRAWTGKDREADAMGLSEVLDVLRQVGR